MGESSSDLMEATPPSSPPPVHHSRHHDHGWRGGGSRLAALLRVRRQKLLRQEQEGRRNLSDSESLGGSVRCRCGTHKGLSRNNSTQSAQSAATVHTLVSSSTASSNRREYRMMILWPFFFRDACLSGPLSYQFCCSGPLPLSLKNKNITLFHQHIS
ncbi:uncharacterized protein LOC135104890 isoform X1 [Scylla paramamosain]|uniref:uncharacterized protein LOC135104890 isoform X1 n=1 Tax=Scylla paramamosain TaxID=85552 RepID=UPI0030828779